jgi:hypothetical protein
MCEILKQNYFYDELLASRSTPKLEGHPSSAVRDCLFNIFAAIPPYLEAVSSIRTLRKRHTVVTRDPLTDTEWGGMDCTELTQDRGQ